MRLTAQQVRSYLEAMPGYLDQLGLFLRPGSRPPDPDARAPKSPAGGRPPIDLGVHDLARDRQPGWLAWRPGDDQHQGQDQSGWRHGVLGTLTLWVMLGESEMAEVDHEYSPCDETDARSLCQWLALHAEFMIANHHGEGDFGTDIKLLHHALRQACGVRPEPVYYCPQCDWVIESRDGGAWWRCTGCQRTWTYANEIDQLLAKQADVVTLAQAALDVGRTPRALRQWRARGWLAPVTRRAGVDQYSLAAVRKVAETVRWGTKRPSQRGVS